MSPVVRLVAFALAVVVAAGGGAAVGSAVGPEPDDAHQPAVEHGEDHQP